jgi:hypothetical protein
MFDVFPHVFEDASLMEPPTEKIPGSFAILFKNGKLMVFARTFKDASLIKIPTEQTLP